jgi:hypothetical protein
VYFYVVSTIASLLCASGLCHTVLVAAGSTWLLGCGGLWDGMGVGPVAGADGRDGGCLDCTLVGCVHQLGRCPVGVLLSG